MSKNEQKTRLRRPEENLSELKEIIYRECGFLSDESRKAIEKEIFDRHDHTNYNGDDIIFYTEFDLIKIIERVLKEVTSGK